MKNRIGVFNILKSKRNVFIKVRSTLKFLFLFIIGIILIAGIVSLVYKPMHKVTLNGEFIGYTSNKSKLQKRINEYMESGEGNIQNTAFIDVENLPEYELCLLKRDNETNDDEIFEKVKSTGIEYYKYYAIVENSKEKYYVSSKEEAESIIDELKSKKSNNISKVAYTQVYSTELKDFTAKDEIVKELYVKPIVKVASSGLSTRIAASAPSIAEIGVTFIKPITGSISSRFGSRSGGTHTGLDIAGSVGTSIVAAASGTVSYVNYSNVSYGNCVKISHGNGVETVYAHCNDLYVTTGQKVSQGQSIATRGSTGNSTGPHLHFEIRVDGLAVNPQNYVY